MSRPFVLVSGDFVKTGGMDRANHALASYLAGRGEEVHLVAYLVGDGLLESAGVTWHRVPRPLGSYSLGRPILDRYGREWAARVMPRGGRVVVNGGNCRWPGVNWVHHVNLLDPPRPGHGALRRLKGRLDHRDHVARERQALARARLVVTTCERNRRDLLEHFDLPPDRVRVAYYGTDPDVFRPASPERRAELRRSMGWPEGRPVFLFVGALGDRRKGFDTLYRAWASLCREPGWHADLAVVGAGADRPHWEARATADGLADRVRFLGFRRDVPDLLRAADAHVLPSRYEGYSLITHEALCCGLPAYVSASAGIAERYPAGLADLLIPDPDDAEALADRLRGHEDLARRIGPALDRFGGSLRLETWDGMAARVARFVDEAG
jgi:glycosyltransferase involved in cell wall biosynthesis